MQDEVVTVTEVDKVIEITRRVSFRYLTIELLGTSPYFDFSINNVWLKAVSSARESAYKFENSCSELIKRIDSVSVEALRV